jgi:hypothetical protein
MTGASQFEKHVKILFDPLNSKSAHPALSAKGDLAKKLGALVGSARKKTDARCVVTPAITSLFATAAVEMWQRAIHSFLISSSATESSPMWASVTGYYASHYCFRGLAHLLGYFQLHRCKRIARVEITGGHYWCHIERKNGNDREHKFYWRTVKSHPAFENNPFFAIEKSKKDDDIALEKSKKDDDLADSAHRNIANYIDHINQFPKFRTLDEAYLVRRIEQLSEIELSSVPVPRLEHYPDLENVQLVAYHRIVMFRKYLDEILGGKNRFWSVHRNPSWCQSVVDFQVVEPRFLKAYSESK